MSPFRASEYRGRAGGLRAQLLLGLVALLVLALAWVALATVQLHSQYIHRTIADEARGHAELLSQLNGESRAAAADALRAQEGILYVGPPPAEAPAGQTEQLRIADYEGQSAIWAPSSPELMVIVSMADAKEAIDDSRRAQILLMLSTLLFVSLVGYAFLSYVVIRPLRALGVATARAAQGDLASPITLLPRNEFGDVGRQFNAMLKRLDDQRATLEEQLAQLSKAHEDLKRTQDSLVRSEKLASVGHLAAGIAHEVGNPLAAVLGYTQMLGSGDVDEAKAQDLTDRILSQLRRIRRIIRQLLDYSRPEAQDAPGATDLADCIDEALHLVQATPAGRHVEVAKNFDELEPIHGVAGSVVQVLVNLFLNAAEAMAEDEGRPARLSIDAAVDGEQVIVDVRDSGPGVDGDIADQIFDPFFTTRAPGDGTGLGLAIAHRLVARVGGDLQLVASDGGAHFRILWKVAESE